MAGHITSITWKSLLLLGIVGSKGLTAFAQTPPAPPSNKPSTQTQVPYNGGTVYQPAGYTAQPPVINYVRTREAMGKVTDANFAAAGYIDVKEATQYIDGLGRPLQTVMRQATPGTSPKDIVGPIEYDQFGREVYKFMPYAQTAGTSSSDGKFKLDPFNDQRNFFLNTYPGEQPSYANEKFFYSQVQYENSPLNRVNKSLSPGNSWMENNKFVEQKYLMNTLADNVRVWDIASDPLTYTNNDLTINIPSNRTNPYATGDLYKNVMIDESGNAVVEYKDKGDKVILKKVQSGTIASDYSGYSGFLCTYYIYDDVNRLRFIIPPKAVAALEPGGWNVGTNTAIIKELCFRYEYDGRGRMVAKQVPGAGWTYMVYDKRDRLVFTQDARMRGEGESRWLGTFYDALNRPVMTALVTNMASYNRETLQTYVDGHTGNGTGSNLTVISSPSPHLTLTLRSVGVTEYKAAYDFNFEEGFVSEPGAEFITTYVDYYADAEVPQPVTDNPVPAGGFLQVLTITHYDDYAWTNKVYSDAYNDVFQYSSIPGEKHAESPLTRQQQQALSTKGMVTGTEARILGPYESAYNLFRMMSSAVFYDDKGRVIQTQSDNQQDGTDITCNLYNFTGQVLGNYMVHTNVTANMFNVRVLTKLDYDHGGRLVSIKKSVNGGPETFIAQNEYDILGQLKTKKLGLKRSTATTYSSDPLQLQDYTYNIRGWLKGINSAYINTGTLSTNDRWFAMDLSYDWGFTTNQFNGNIAGTKWRSAGDGEKRAYGFNYDKVNRLMAADFSQNSGGTYTDLPAINFDMTMGDGADPNSAYDENGNINKMVQWGMKIGGSDVIDNLTYNYIPNTNKLLNVIDAKNDPVTKLGDFRTSDLSPNKNNRTASTEDYQYDLNGNLIKDLNKDIGTASESGIVYNFLNLPRYITIQGASGEKGYIQYTYDATGRKLSKEVHESGTTPKTTITDYVGGMVYESNILQFIGQEEGRIRYKPAVGNTEASFVYDYFLKDHLGNVRSMLTDEKEVLTYPAATLEGTDGQTGQPNAITTEKQYYTIVSGNVKDRAEATGLSNFDYSNNNGNPPYNNNPNSNTETSSQKVYKLDGVNSKTGLGITLKVMAGDKFSVAGMSYYHQNNTGGSSANNAVPVLELINGLLGTPTGIGASKATSADLNGNSVIRDALADFISRPGRDDPQATTKPKASINWILLDEQFKFVDGNFSSVKTPDYPWQHTGDAALTDIPVTKSGYLYVYVSNESPVPVFFDNLQVVHDKGALLEETHYYPFGLIQKGISTEAINTQKNKYKFNGIEHNNDFDINLYEAFYRNLDPQVSRYWQVDPKSIDEVSPYSVMLNNPILMNDPLGDTTYYYNSSGELLHTTLAKGYQNIFIIANGQLDYFKKSFAILDKYNAGLDVQELFDKVTLSLNKNSDLGEAYDLKSISAFFENNNGKNAIKSIAGFNINIMENITLDDKPISRDFLKRIKGAEVSFNMEKRNGVWTVDAIGTENDMTESYGGNPTDPNGHLHPYIPILEGKTIRFYYQAQFGKAPYKVGPVFRNQGPSGRDGDFGKAKEQGKMGGTVRNIVVNYGFIYFYNGNGDMIRVNRPK